MIFNIAKIKTVKTVAELHGEVTNLIQLDGITVLQRIHYLMIQLMRECVVFDTVIPALIPAIGSFCVKSLLPSDKIDLDITDAFSSFLTGVVWMIDLELEIGLDQVINVDIKTSKQRNTLVHITKSMAVSKLINSTHLMERLELDFLELMQFIESQQKLNKMIIRSNTASLYAQQKYNLLREESEGYAKLVTELSTCLPLTYNNNDNNNQLLKLVLNTVENIQALIGFFNLDPNRVLDVIFDVFTAQVLNHWQFFVQLLLNSPWKPRTVKSTENLLVELKPRSICGQLLGFKFASFNTTDQSGIAPKELYLSTAILIKHHIVNFDDVFIHLGPSLLDMEKETELYQQEISQRLKDAGKFSSVGLTGSLMDDTKSSATKADGKVEDAIKVDPFKSLKESNQKAQLCQSLIEIGCFEQGIQILTLYPQMSTIHPGIAMALSRILDAHINSLYSAISPLQKVNISSNNKNSRQKFAESWNSCDITICNDFQKSGRPEFKYFYSQWQSNIVQCVTYDQFMTIANRLLTFIGINLYKDLRMTTKLMRLGAHYLSLYSDQVSAKNNWMAIVAEYLFPAIAQLDGNPSFANELYSIVKQFPYETRFALYGQWKHVTYGAIPELTVARAGCTKDTRYIMRRLSKENVKQYGRYIGKTVHSNPAIAFTIIIDQLQSYDNQIPHVVDASRYLTELEFDVLNFCMLEALSNSTKERIQPSGTLISKWLVALATFCGTLWRKHPIELKGLLHYVTNQLLTNNILDLLVLQELISQMAGIKLLDESTADQLDAFAGGELLRREALQFENLRIIRKPSKRLTRALLDTNLDTKLGYLLAQTRRDIAYSETGTKDLKITGWMFDHCHKTLVQYFDFLMANVDRSSYPNLFGGLDELCGLYGLEPEVAFHILRPKFTQLMKEEHATNNLSEGVWSNALKCSIEAAHSILPADIISRLSPAFYVTFWQLSLYDIYIPRVRYAAEIKKNKSLASKIDDSLKLPQTSRATIEFRKEKERHLEIIAQLEKELIGQDENYKRVASRLAIEKLNWFTTTESDITSLVCQYCIFPRALFTAQDAIFSSKLLLLLHTIGTKNWKSLVCFDKIFSRETIHSIVFSCSENEARNYGVFLAEILKHLTAWHKDSKLYIKECTSNNLPGFGKKTIVSEDLKSETVQHYSFEEYRQLMYKWHMKIRKAFEQCLKSKEYMQTRNAIIVLDKIRLSFPIIRNSGEILEKIAKDIELTEERGDLKQLARSYHAKLQSCKENWIPLHRFSSLSAAEVRSDAQPKPRFNVEAKAFVPIRISTKHPSADLSLVSAMSATTPLASLADPVIISSPLKADSTILDKKSAAILSKYSKHPAAVDKVPQASTNQDLEAKRILVKSTLESKIDKEKKLNEQNKLTNSIKKVDSKETVDSKSKNSIDVIDKMRIGVIDKMRIDVVDTEKNSIQNESSTGIANSSSKLKHLISHEDGEVKESATLNSPRKSTSRSSKSNDKGVDLTRVSSSHSLSNTEKKESSSRNRDSSYRHARRDTPDRHRRDRNERDRRDGSIDRDARDSRDSRESRDSRKRVAGSSSGTRDDKRPRTSDDKDSRNSERSRR